MTETHNTEKEFAAAVANCREIFEKNSRTMAHHGASCDHLRSPTRFSSRRHASARSKPRARQWSTKASNLNLWAS